MKGVISTQASDLDALREQLREQEGRISSLQEQRETDEEDYLDASE